MAESCNAQIHSTNWDWANALSSILTGHFEHFNWFINGKQSFMNKLSVELPNTFERDRDRENVRRREIPIRL